MSQHGEATLALRHRLLRPRAFLYDSHARGDRSGSLERGDARAEGLRKHARNVDSEREISDRHDSRLAAHKRFSGMTAPNEKKLAAHEATDANAETDSDADAQKNLGQRQTKPTQQSDEEPGQSPHYHRRLVVIRNHETSLAARYDSRNGMGMPGCSRA